MTVAQGETRAFTREHLSTKKTNEILSPQIFVSRHGPVHLVLARRLLLCPQLCGLEVILPTMLVSV